jgi:gephyrin
MLRNTLRATMSSKLRAAIIVVSETASKDSSTDKCIPALQEVFQQDGGDRWEPAQTRIVADDVSAIRDAIKAYTDGADSANLVVTSGGTGFAQKDVTPEVSNFMINTDAITITHIMKCQ